MKFSSTFVLAVLPLLSQLVSASPVAEAGLAARAQQQNQRKGGGGAAAAAAAQKQKQAQAAAAAKAKAAAAAAAAKNKGNKGATGKVVGNGTGAAAVSSSAASTATAAAGGAANNAGSGAAAGTGGAASSADPQTSLTLDPRVLCTGFEQDGQANATAGQVPSATSVNNFINSCLLTPNLPLTNGKQITTGSCNPAPIGVIPDTAHMPSAKFVFPTNGGAVTANQAFTVQLAINNLNAGHFTNAETNYFAAPQTVDNTGTIIGHTHVTIETLPSLDSTTPTNPKNFFFFKGINTAAVNGVVTAAVAAGVPAGSYRICSINTSSNHAPVIVPVAQHGALDDCVYFTSSANGQAAAASGAAAAGGAAANTATAAAASATTAAAAAGNAAAGTAAAGTAAAAGAANSKGAAATGAAANNKGAQGAAAAKAAQQAAQAKAAAAAKAAQQAKQAKGQQKGRGGRR